MAGKMDLHVDNGTTFSFIVSEWGVQPEIGPLEPYDLTGATATLLIWDPTSVYTQTTYPLSIDGDEIHVELTDKETAELPRRSEYAVEVVFASGEVKHAIEGNVYGSHPSWRDRYHVA